MSKKVNSFHDLGGFVFSTNKDFEFDNESNVEETVANNQQRLEAHLDKKNRGGKVATIIKGFQGRRFKNIGENVENQMWCWRFCKG